MNDDNDKKLTVVYAPGCFDNFDGTEEELQELMEEIQRQIESGEFFDNMEPLTLEDIAEMPEGMFDDMMKSVEGLDEDPDND